MIIPLLSNGAEQTVALIATPQDEITNRLEGRFLNLTISRESYYCRLWSIQTKAGTIFYFTDHDSAISFGGNTYEPADGLDGSNRQDNGGLGASDFNARGVVSSSAITELMLESGQLIDQRVEERIVDHRFPWAGLISYKVFYIRKIRRTPRGYEATVEGQPRRLQAKRGRTASSRCWKELYGPECGVDINDKLDTGGSVVAVDPSGNGSEVEFTYTGVSAGRASGAHVVWQTGDNSGTTSIVNRADAVNGSLILQAPPARPIQAGDTFNYARGCNHLFGGDCVREFANGANFGGLMLPGDDRRYTTPDIKT